MVALSQSQSMPVVTCEENISDSQVFDLTHSE